MLPLKQDQDLSTRRIPSLLRLNFSACTAGLSKNGRLSFFLAQRPGQRQGTAASPRPFCIAYADLRHCSPGQPSSDRVSRPLTASLGHNAGQPCAAAAHENSWPPGVGEHRLLYGRRQSHFRRHGRTHLCVGQTLSPLPNLEHPRRLHQPSRC